MYFGTMMGGYFGVLWDDIGGLFVVLLVDGGGGLFGCILDGWSHLCMMWDDGGGAV